VAGVVGVVGVVVGVLMRVGRGQLRPSGQNPFQMSFGSLQQQRIQLSTWFRGCSWVGHTVWFLVFQQDRQEYPRVIEALAREHSNHTVSCTHDVKLAMLIARSGRHGPHRCCSRLAFQTYDGIENDYYILLGCYCEPN
jgi:hypothetical protein